MRTFPIELPRVLGQAARGCGRWWQRIPARRRRWVLAIGSSVGGAMTVVVLAAAFLSGAPRGVGGLVLRLGENGAAELTGEMRAEMERFGAEVAAALKADMASGRAAGLIDAGALTRLVVGDLELSPSDREGFVRRVGEAVRARGAEAFDGAAGRPAKFLRTHVREGMPGALIRSIESDGEPHYLEVFVERIDSQWRVVEVYSHRSGTLSSERFRTIILPDLGDRYPKAVAGLFGIDEPAALRGGFLWKFLDASRAGPGAAVLTAATALPEPVLRRRAARPILVAAALECGEPAALAALQHGMLKSGDRDAGFGWHALREFRRVGDTVSARQCLERVRRDVGDDAMLDVAEAQLCLDEARFEQASTLLESALKKESGLDIGLGLNLARVLGRQNFPAAVGLLEAHRKRTGQAVGPADLAAPVFREFARSEEFSAWQQGHPPGNKSTDG